MVAEICTFDDPGTRLALFGRTIRGMRLSRTYWPVLSRMCWGRTLKTLPIPTVSSRI